MLLQATSLLEGIPKMFSQTQHADACVGAAVQASIDTLKVLLLVRTAQLILSYFDALDVPTMSDLGSNFTRFVVNQAAAHGLKELLQALSELLSIGP